MSPSNETPDTPEPRRDDPAIIPPQPVDLEELNESQRAVLQSVHDDLVGGKIPEPMIQAVMEEGGQNLLILVPLSLSEEERDGLGDMMYQLAHDQGVTEFFTVMAGRVEGNRFRGMAIVTHHCPDDSPRTFAVGYQIRRDRPKNVGAWHEVPCDDVLGLGDPWLEEPDFQSCLAHPVADPAFAERLDRVALCSMGAPGTDVPPSIPLVAYCAADGAPSVETLHYISRARWHSKLHPLMRDGAKHLLVATNMDVRLDDLGGLVSRSVPGDTSMNVALHLDEGCLIDAYVRLLDVGGDREALRFAPIGPWRHADASLREYWQSVLRLEGFEVCR